MDAVEFVKTMREVCHQHETCLGCPFGCKEGGCDVCTARDPREFVRIAEKWAGEHIKKDEEDKSRNVLELYVALADKVDLLANKVDLLAEKIKVAESKIEESRHLTDATFGEVDERFAEMYGQIALCLRTPVETKIESKTEKRTRMDILAEAFPDAVVAAADGIPVVCPAEIDSNHRCGQWDTVCDKCRRKYWAEEVDKT